MVHFVKSMMGAVWPAAGLVDNEIGLDRQHPHHGATFYQHPAFARAVRGDGEVQLLREA